MAAIPGRQAPRPDYQPHVRPPRRRAPHRLPKGASRREARVRRGRFLVLVVIPVLLMMGSVYLHTVAAGLGAEVQKLEERQARVESEKEQLDLRVAELSAPARIQTLARRDLQMRQPGGASLKVYRSEGGDG